VLNLNELLGHRHSEDGQIVHVSDDSPSLGLSSSCGDLDVRIGSSGASVGLVVCSSSSGSGVRGDVI
jgi:hypothetical protein